MKFYSYNYLLNHIAKFDWWGLIFVIFLSFCLILTIYKYLKSHKETKYRELAIILALSIVVLISSKISQYRITSINDGKYRTTIYLIELIAKNLKIDKEKIYINNSTSMNEAIIKLDNTFFRIITEDNGENFLLEKIEFHNPKVELIEVKK